MCPRAKSAWTEILHLLQPLGPSQRRGSWGVGRIGVTTGVFKSCHKWFYMPGACVPDIQLCLETHFEYHYFRNLPNICELATKCRNLLHCVYVFQKEAKMCLYKINFAGAVLWRGWHHGSTNFSFCVQIRAWHITGSLNVC